MKQNFFDQLDGGWGDLIADTYKKANDNMLLFRFNGEIHKLMKPSFYKEDDLSFYHYLSFGTSDIEVNTLNIMDVHKIFDIKDTVETYKIFDKSKQFTTTFSNILINNEQTYSEFFKSFIEHPYPYNFYNRGELITINSDEDINNTQITLTIGCFTNEQGEEISALSNNNIIGELSTFETENYTVNDIFNMLDKYKK